MSRLFLTLLLFIVALVHNNLSGQEDSQPNIVLFLVDDMGWQDTSVPFWNQTTDFNRRYRTPNMERLTQRGMKFTNAYACAVCSPSRISLMTGLNAARHRVTDWTLNYIDDSEKKLATRGNGNLRVPQWNINGLSPRKDIPLSVQARCLPAILKDAGYRTIHVGKAHFGALTTPAANPMAIGFDVNVAGHAPGGPASYYGKRNFSVNPKQPGANVWDIPGLEKYHGKDIFLTEALTLEATQAIDQAVSDKKPFFLYMAHYAIHAPLQSDPRFVDHYSDLPPSEAAYASLIEGMDKSLGDLLDRVEHHGLSDQTIILFMSDNGGLSAHARAGPAHTHNRPLSSGKGSNHEGGIRVPMMVQWPGKTQSGSTCDDAVIIEDFFPTILEMAGINVPQQNGVVIDGVSFTRQLQGESGLSRGRHLVWHYPNHWGPTGPGINFCSAIRKDNWKLIYYHDVLRAQGQYELFNLTEDIGETNNLANRFPNRVKELAQALSTKLVEYKAQMPIVKATGETCPLPLEASNGQNE